MVEIKKQLAPVRPGANCYGTGNKKTGVTIHQTGNARVGANAQMHANLQSAVYSASWHWQVDDKEAIQSFEHDVQCWHASDGRGQGNQHTIAIESCINADGNYLKSIDNLVELAAHILKQEKLTVKDVHQHNHWDTKYRKNCPAQIRAGKDGVTWDIFLNRVQDELDRLNFKPVVKGALTTQSEGVIDMQGTFVANDTIIVRDQPTTKARHIATYKKGESLIYEAVHFKNGYVWLQYARAVGGKGYIPIAPLAEMWGTLK